MTEYIKTELKQPVTVQNIITVHYFEYTKNFAFTGEAHDFWEIVFADKGDLYITAGSSESLLRQGQMYLHRPMEFHNIRCDGKTASNSVIVTVSLLRSGAICRGGQRDPLRGRNARLIGGHYFRGEKILLQPARGSLYRMPGPPPGRAVRKRAADQNLSGASADRPHPRNGAFRQNHESAQGPRRRQKNQRKCAIWSETARTRSRFTTSVRNFP